MIEDTSDLLLKKIPSMAEFVTSKETTENSTETEVYHKELENLREQLREKLREFKETLLEQEGALENEDGRSNRGQTSPKPPKNNHQKPPEIAGDCSPKDFEAWKRKVVDYFILSGIDKCL